MSGEAEPRRSVRATKGQHTKSFDELEPAAAPKRRQTKKTKKAQEQEQEQDQEDQDQEQGQDAEVIRCVCGATEQDEDSGEAWISCETCFAWQHNVCVGVSSYEDEIPENYWCEQCRPENHKELLEGMARGEKPWEARRKAHEEESKKKRKGGRKAKGKRTSDPKDELEKDGRAKSKASPTPEAGSKDKSEPVAAPATKQGKRKSREDSHDTDGKTAKLRRVSENEAVPVGPAYNPPDDLAKSITELPNTRVGPAKALKKSLIHVLTSMAKSGDLEVPADSTVDAVAETYALQIERAVLDTHPPTKNQKEYGQQIKSLTFNLKNNPELCHGLVAGMHTPPTLAIMTSDQLASAELQRQTAEMKARAEKQSILYTGETGPRVRRTHKGEEVVEDESAVTTDVPPPMPGSRRNVPQLQQPQPQHIKHESIDSPQGDGYAQHSPSNPNFDISKVFSSVKSASPGAGGQLRRTSTAASVNGPGVDPDVDRMLQDDGGDDFDIDSPPYSPTEEAPPDPDVVWRGTLAMSSIANFQAVAKHVGGANFSTVGPWTRLMPKHMTVAGRIQQQSAIEYLCGLRYSNLTDVVVVSISPVSPDSRSEFNALIDYFVSKKRYGVIGDKVAGNVRDTYLVPVPPGEGGHPEFMLNLVDNYLPKTRTEPMLLAVFVYRNEPEQLKQQLQQTKDATPSTAPAVQQTPVPIPLPAGASQPANSPPLATGANAAGFAQRSNSVSAGPAFSPATPQAPTFPTQSVSTTPVPIPQPPHTNRPPPPPTPSSASVSASVTPAPAQAQQQQPPQAPGQPVPLVTPGAGGQMSDLQKFQAQAAGQKIAQEVLRELIHVPTAQFLLPQAFQMSRREWEIIRGIYERDQRAREDLNYLGSLIEKQGAEAKASS
ncbi:Transcription factor BYE1 [Paramyrothecium foliicola]|nr:Transcription factor BYE1 [Paramyrothecium foliicola]